MLIQLLYASRACEALTPAVLDAILQRSRTKNPSIGVTGILCHSNEIFMQLLEGGRSQVNELYNQIARDPRHREVMLLSYAEVSERRFAGWTMGQVNLAKINPAILLKFSERPVLDPYLVSGQVSMALLEELLATAAIVCRPSN